MSRVKYSTRTINNRSVIVEKREIKPTSSSKRWEKPCKIYGNEWAPVTPPRRDDIRTTKTYGVSRIY